MQNIKNELFSDKWLNLADERLETTVLECSDDFFAKKENIIKSGRGVFDPDLFYENGKVMDGWESRRKRKAGHDYIIIQLGAPGIIRGIDVDTNHFTGNYPEAFSFEVSNSQNNSDFEWIEIIPKTELSSSSQHLIKIENEQIWTHVKFNIYPDGGVARLKIYGEPFFDKNKLSSQLANLAAIEYGAQAIKCSNEHFSDKRNLLFPKKSKNMGDGWETKRRRGMDWEKNSIDERYAKSGYDWVIIQLAQQGKLSFIDIDTSFFKGNYPYSCTIDAALLTDQQQSIEEVEWKQIVPEYFLHQDQQHLIEIQSHFQDQIFNHIRLNIYPDGGIARFKVYGHIQ